MFSGKGDTKPFTIAAEKLAHVFFKVQLFTFSNTMLTINIYLISIGMFTFAYKTTVQMSNKGEKEDREITKTHMAIKLEVQLSLGSIQSEDDGNKGLVFLFSKYWVTISILYTSIAWRLSKMKQHQSNKYKGEELDELNSIRISSTYCR